MSRLTLSLSVIAVAALALPAAAQDYPEPGKPITLLNNFSGTGQVFRALNDFQPFFQEEFGTQIVIEQVEGAAGLVGYNTAFSRPADGYTILPMSTNFGPHTFPHLSQADTPWSFDDWRIVGVYADNLSSGFVVHADSSIETFTDFVEAARAAPGELTVGTIGPGRIEDVQIAELQQFFDLKINHVYYGSSSALHTDLLTGDLDVIMASAIRFADDPDLRIITMLAPAMTEAFLYQDLNTMADWQEDLNYDVDDLRTLAATQRYALVVKVGLPDDVFDRIVEGLANVVNNPEWQAKVADYRDVVWYPPEEAKAVFVDLNEAISDLSASRIAPE